MTFHELKRVKYQSTTIYIYIRLKKKKTLYYYIDLCASYTTIKDI